MRLAHATSPVNSRFYICPPDACHTPRKLSRQLEIYSHSNSTIEEDDHEEEEDEGDCDLTVILAGDAVRLQKRYYAPEF